MWEGVCVCVDAIECLFRKSEITSKLRFFDSLNTKRRWLWQLRQHKLFATKHGKYAANGFRLGNWFGFLWKKMWEIFPFSCSNDFAACFQFACQFYRATRTFPYFFNATHYIFHSYRADTVSEINQVGFFCFQFPLLLTQPLLTCDGILHFI